MVTFINRIRNRYNILWDKINGVDFNTIIPVNELGFDEASVFRGSSSRGKRLKIVFSALNIKEGAKILDIGCAKGGALYDFYNFPFVRIDGIEISNRLSYIAKKNLLKKGLVKTIIYNCNAKDFLNYGEYEYFYLYNPFDLETLRVVINRITSQNKKFTLVYHNPIGHDLLVDMGFDIIECYSGLYGNKIVVYSFTYHDLQIN